MNYSIRPSGSELSRARSRVEASISKIEHSVDIDSFDVYIAFRPNEFTSSATDGDSVILFLDPDSEFENLDLALARGVLTLEFDRKKEWEDPFLPWQRFVRAVYVESRSFQLVERESGEQEYDWSEVRASVDGEAGSALHPEVGLAAADMGERHEPEEILEWGRSDLLEAGDMLGE